MACFDRPVDKTMFDQAALECVDQIETRTLPCLWIEEGLSNVCRQTGCASLDLPIQHPFLTESSLALIGAVHLNRPRAIGVNRPYLIRARLSANCKRCFIRKCWVARFRCWRLQKMSILKRIRWRVSNSRASHPTAAEDAGRFS